MKEFTVKENTGFRLRIRSWKCLSPSDLNSVEFINESLNDEGEVSMSSTYSFFMDDKEIRTLCEGLLKS
jgi:hypothetical protein